MIIMLNNALPVLKIQDENDPESPVDIYPKFPPEVLYASPTNIKSVKSSIKKPVTHILWKSANHSSKGKYLPSSNAPIVFPAPKFTPLHNQYQLQFQNKSYQGEVFVSILPWERPFKRIQSPIKKPTKTFDVSMNSKKNPCKRHLEHQVNNTAFMTKANKIIIEAKQFLIKNDIDNAFQCLSGAIDQGIDRKSVV